METLCMWFGIGHLTQTGTLAWTHDGFCCTKTWLLGVGFPSHLGSIGVL